MSRIQITLCPSPSPAPIPEGPMKANQPDPPIRELRNRWPFFSEGELKWLLSPKKPGSGHTDYHEEMESHMAATMESTMQQDSLHKAGHGAESCPGPVLSESPVAFALEDNFEAKDTHSQAAGSLSDFTFLNDRFNKQGVRYSTEMGSLGPRALLFQDVVVSRAEVDQEGHSANRVNRIVDGEDQNITFNAPYAVENAHLNPFHMNPFAEGLEPLAGEDMQEEAPIVFTNHQSLTDKGPVVEESSSGDHSTGQYFTPTKECHDEQESSHKNVDSEVEDEEEEEDEEGEAVHNCVKRMSFELSDGKQVPKFSPDDVLLAINCGGVLLENERCGITFKEDNYYTGGDILRTNERVIGVHDASLYQTSRYGNVSYVFKDLRPGNCIVDLHFAEIIFTNGPPGMRVFDVTVQAEKVISELDVYEEVGSNNALILSVTTSTSNGNLAVTFEGVIGSPTISAICIRTGPPSSCAEVGPKVAASKSSLDGTTQDSEPLGYEQELLRKDREMRQIIEHKARRQKAKKRTRNSEYEAKLKELMNECHEAWISLQDSNRMNEMLQNDLCAKSLCCDSLATAVETQLSEMNAIKERYNTERQRFIKTMTRAHEEILILKEEQKLLSQRTKEWVASFPDPTVMTASVQSLLNEHQDLRKKYADECYERKQLYNKVLELKGNIRVFCRCRPLSEAELAASAVSVAEFESAGNGDLVVRNGTAGKKMFKFDRVFSPQDGQSDVFADTAPVVVSVLDGFNVCIFAYGQTGTGKTFTMEGCVGNRGVNYRTLEELFNIVAQRKGEINYEISVSVMEVYNEQIRDLLAPSAVQDQPTKKLEIKQAAEGGHHVPGLVEAHVTSMEEVWDVLQAGSSSRTVGSTRANDHSSRSHCMLCVMVKGENTITGECTKSKLWLVDLAGSERVAKSDAQGDRLKEAQNINKSLSALGDVIQALTMKSSHIPFRNSKLTHLLQDSLGGDSKTLMFVQISPNEADVSETLCSLNFASRVRGVELGPARKHLDSNELFKYKQLAEKSKQDSRYKEEGLKKLEEKLQAAEAKLKAKEQTSQALSDKVKEIAELDAQLLNERRARQAAEAMYREQKATMERMAAESKLSLDKFAEKSAVELKQAKEALAAELKQTKEALGAELKKSKESLDFASVAHAKEVSRLLQQIQQLQQQTTEAGTTLMQGPAASNSNHTPIETMLRRPAQASEARTTPMQGPAATNSNHTPVETMLRRPALVETGSTSNASEERIPTIEYVVKPPDASEIMRNSCTGEVFANENAAPLQNLEPQDGQPKTKGILKPSGPKHISPNIPTKRGATRRRLTGFTGVNVKPAVQLNSLRRSQESAASSSNSVATSLSEEELQKLCGGLDMIATSNTSAFDAGLQTLAHVLESTTPPNCKGASVSRIPHQKSVHFRTPLLLPPREDVDVRENGSPMDSENSYKLAPAIPVSKIPRRTTSLPSRPLSKAPAAGLAHRVVANTMKQPIPVLREKRWN